MTGVFLNMVGIYLYLKLLRLVSLFKSESETNLIGNIRFSKFAIRLLFKDINSK